MHFRAIAKKERFDVVRPTIQRTKNAVVAAPRSFGADEPFLCLAISLAEVGQLSDARLEVEQLGLRDATSAPR